MILSKKNIKNLYKCLTTIKEVLQLAFMNSMQSPFIPVIPFMPAQPILARAYVPYQLRYNTFEINEGYHKGTLFPDLYRPYPVNNIPRGYRE